MRAKTVRCKGPDPKNSCTSCKWWHRGLGVSHNHCDYPYILRDDRRANGHYSLPTRINGVKQPIRNCVVHSDPKKQIGEDKKAMRAIPKLICVHCGKDNGIDYRDITLCIRCMALTRAQPNEEI